jgi:hypothetical protein
MPKSKLRKKRKAYSTKNISKNNQASEMSKFKQSLLFQMNKSYLIIEREQLPIALKENGINQTDARLQTKPYGPDKSDVFGKDYSYRGNIILKTRMELKTEGLEVQSFIVINGIDQVQENPFNIEL